MIIRIVALQLFAFAVVATSFTVPQLTARTSWRQFQERIPRLRYSSENPEEAPKLSFVSSTTSSSNQTSSSSKATADGQTDTTNQATAATPTKEDRQQPKRKQREDKLILPNTRSSSNNAKPINATASSSIDDADIIAEPPEPIQKQGRLKSRLQRLTHKVQTQWKLFCKSQRTINPGMKFRLRITVATITLASVLSFFLPATRAAGGAKGLKSVLAVLTRWLSSRGFQGIAALGRSVAYGWALFVGYPRLLDRRAQEKKKREREKALERWRVYLRSLAAEVVRLRQELSSIDSEIRAFRREIISLKASLSKYEKSSDVGATTTEEPSYPSSSKDQWNDDIQEAITQEMTHLRQLREDTKQALTAARETWSEMRAKSPLEAWEADDFLLVASPDPSYTMPPSL